MRDPEIVDYIIVGQGLAGSCLALQLLNLKKSIVVFDVPADNHASAVAAGLFNPFTGRVMVKTWMADTLFSYLDQFYQQAERSLGTRFYHRQSIYRPFISVQEQNGWMGKSADPAFSGYIKSIFLKATVPHVNDAFGGLVLNHAGYVDVPVFLDAVRAHLKSLVSYRAEKLDELRLETSADFVSYDGVRASGIIFCNGMEISKGQGFAWLPINPLKGETITVNMQATDYILNRGVYVVPGKAPEEFRVGATYDFQSTLPGITEGGKEELTSKLEELVKAPFTVTGQHWGIRPTTLDQKIMLGAHPKWQNHFVFNGLGTKGVSLAPYFSDQLVQCLLGKQEILPEVNIQRYKALYSKLL